MYNYHDVSFIWFTLPLSFGLLALYIILKEKKILVIPSIDIILVLICAFQIILGLEITERDNHFFRAELRNIESSKVKSLTIIQDKIQTKIENKKLIIQFFSIIQSVKRISAHHSSPIEAIKIIFTYKDNIYKYTLFKDSENDNEYWIFSDRLSGTDRSKVEIGRIVSNALDQFINKLNSLSGVRTDRIYI